MAGGSAAALRRLRAARQQSLSQHRRRRVLHRALSVAARRRIPFSHSSFRMPFYSMFSPVSEDGPMRGQLGALAAGMLLAGIADGHAATKLAPNDVQATFFNGQPFTASTPSGVKFKMVFNA